MHPSNETLSLFPPDAPVAERPGQVTPIYLVGMMGAGKTTIGRGLARALGREFVDVDQLIENRCGVRVPVIFEVEGEAGFRQRESCIIDEYTRRPMVVLATGGGAVLSEINRRMLAERGVVIYLRARADDLYQRTKADRNRPLLQTADPLARIRELLALREPMYESVADVVVDTGKMSIARLVQKILPLLDACGKTVPSLPPLQVQQKQDCS
jgi:shikimate kinase